MSPNSPLTGCAIAGSLKNVDPGFAAVASSLLYQSAALGMRLEVGENRSEETALSFEIRTPHTTPVRCDITRWDDRFLQAAVTENIMQAACGLMSVHGRASGKCQPLGLDYISTLTAVLALQSGIAASIGQLRGLSVSNSTISMASAGLLAVGQYIADATASESPETILPGASSYSAGLPFVSLDGVIFELETLNAESWQKFWAQAGASSAVAGRGWKNFLLRYARAVSPLPDELFSAISNLTYYSISQICSRTGMSICPIRSIGDRAHDGDSKDVWLQGPWAFSFESNRNPGCASLASSDLPLSGLTVIESCRRIQGPLAGHLLALLGANVIRIEPPGGDPLRGMPPMAEGCSARFDALNRLKTIREIDIKSSAGQAEIKDLMRHADVFLHNWAPGKAVLLNLDHDDLRGINPSLVYAYAAGWATDNSTHVSCSSMPGTDFMAQAYSGIAKKIAGACGIRGGSLFTVLDVLGGAVAAQGVTLALLNRCMNHVGGKVTSSLMSAATLLCADDFRGLYTSPESGAKPAPSIINAVYSTRRGKVALDCPDLKTLLQLAEALPNPINVEEDDFQQYLEHLFLSKTADEWVGIFRQAGVPAAVVIEDLADLQSVAHLQPGLSPGSYTKVNSPWRFR